MKDLNVQKNISLKDHTTYKVGGPAEYFFIAGNLEELQESLKWASEKGLEVTILGNGSNVVVSDEGLKGLVIINKSNEINIDKNSVRVDSGVQLNDLIKNIHKEGKGGIEFLANIPGTVGGAVAGNAGCYGKYAGDHLQKATVFHNGKVEEVAPSFFEYEYRSSKIKRGYRAIVIDATFEISDVNVEESRKMIEDDKELRDTKHPKEPSCGSFFKNPSRKNSAGKLIEECGLKGFEVGGARVSEKHANFIINTGNATAADIYRLAKEVMKKVRDKTGYELEEEVKYLGEF